MTELAACNRCGIPFARQGAEGWCPSCCGWASETSEAMLRHKAYGAVTMAVRTEERSLVAELRAITGLPEGKIRRQLRKMEKGVLDHWRVPTAVPWSTEWIYSWRSE